MVQSTSRRSGKRILTDAEAAASIGRTAKAPARLYKASKKKRFPNGAVCLKHAEKERRLPYHPLTDQEMAAQGLPPIEWRIGVDRTPETFC